MKRLMKAMLLGAGLCALLNTQPAFAYTECSAQVKSIWSGAGHIRIYLTNGADAIIFDPTQPTNTAILSMAMTALNTSRTVVVRYQADDVDCASAVGRTDFIGMHLS